MQPVTLVQLWRLPVRLTLNPPLPVDSNSPPIRLHGTVATVTADSLMVDLVEPFPALLETGPITLEILHPDGLLRAESPGPVLHTESPLRVGLAGLPITEPEWVQRRQHVRADMRLGCRLITGNRSCPQLHEGITHNISAGGVAVEVGARLEVGERLALEFDPVPQLSVQTLLAEVMRVTPTTAHTYILGMRFVDLTPQVQQVLDNVVITMNLRPESQ